MHLTTQKSDGASVRSRLAYISRKLLQPFLAKESQSSLANSTGNLSAPAAYGEPSPALSSRGLQGGYGEPAGLGLSAASLPYDGGSPYA